MLKVLFTMLGLIAFAPFSCVSQIDPRWSLWNGMITAPEEEIRTAAALRLVQDQRVTQMVLTSAGFASLSLEKDKLIANKDVEITAIRDALSATDTALQATEGERDTWRKAARRTKGSKWWQIPAAIALGFFVGKELSR